MGILCLKMLCEEGQSVFKRDILIVVKGGKKVIIKQRSPDQSENHETK